MAQRRLLLPPFHGERMQAYADVMHEAAERELAKLPLGSPVPLLPATQAMTLEVIMRAVFGVTDAGRLDHLRTCLRRLVASSTSPLRLVQFALRSARGNPEAPRGMREHLEAADAALLREIRATREDPAVAEREDILALLVRARHEDGSPMDDGELRDELTTLLLAGHETTATALAWALERLLRHPTAMERLRAELEAGEEEYLDAVIKETLRLRPVVPIVVRRLTRPLELGGYRLEAGTMVAPSIYLVHRRPDVYPDPHSFRPERFLETPPGTYTWIPFGGGVRRCLGASFATFEMKVVLRAIVLGTRLRSHGGGDERVRRRAVIFSPARGAQVVLEERRAPVAA
jgi:cytochrome P450